MNTHLGLRVDVHAKPHELGGCGGAALESSVHDREHERSLAILQHAQRPRSVTISRPKPNRLTRTHLALRVDVRTKPYELGGRGGVAPASSAHVRSLAPLQHAQRPRSAQTAKQKLEAPALRDGQRDCSQRASS